MLALEVLGYFRCQDIFLEAIAVTMLTDDVVPIQAAIKIIGHVVATESTHLLFLFFLEYHDTMAISFIVCTPGQKRRDVLNII